MGWSSNRCFPSAVQGAAAKMAAMVSPPMPAMTTVSASSGATVSSPGPRRKSIRSATPQVLPVARARSRGPARRSLAMAERSRPASISHTGRYAWSVPISARRAPSLTQLANRARRGVSSNCFKKRSSSVEGRIQAQPVCVRILTGAYWPLRSPGPAASRSPRRGPCRPPPRSRRGKRAAQAVHADGQEDGRGVGGNIQDITDDGVFCDLNHG